MPGMPLMLYIARSATRLGGVPVGSRLDACWSDGLRARRRSTEIPSASRGRNGALAMPGATVSDMTRPVPSPDTVMLSAHAVDQYQHRLKPALDVDTARGELERLRLLGEISPEAPEWVNAARPAPYYLLLGDAIVLPLAPQGQGWVATTCVTQRTLTSTRRSAKSARKTSLAARKRAQRRARF